VRYYRAQDNAVGEFPDGRAYGFCKGDVLPENHEVVRWDRDHGGKNWLQLPSDEPEPAAPAAPKRAAAAAVAAK
jgi:hypothetical protein